MQIEGFAHPTLSDERQISICLFQFSISVAFICFSSSAQSHTAYFQSAPQHQDDRKTEFQVSLNPVAQSVPVFETSLSFPADRNRRGPFRGRRESRPHVLRRASEQSTVE